MPDSPRRQITKSGRVRPGPPLGTAPVNKLPSQLPELKGRRFGKLMVVSGEVLRQKGRPYLLTECTGCGKREPKAYTNIMQNTAGCRSCGNPRSAPKWLVSRCIAAKGRCTNPADPRWKDYGTRGIEFRFSGPTAMAVWIMENLGLDRELTIDRIDNSGHYEPGNLRLTNRRVQTSNTRKRRLTPAMHAFRQEHPDVKYADATLIRLIGKGLSWEKIVDRYYNLPSSKPKGVYGTFSTPDPVIASLRKDY